MYVCMCLRRGDVCVNITYVCTYIRANRDADFLQGAKGEGEREIALVFSREPLSRGHTTVMRFRAPLCDNFPSRPAGHRHAVDK